MFNGMIRNDLDVRLYRGPVATVRSILIEGRAALHYEVSIRWGQQGLVEESAASGEFGTWQDEFCPSSHLSDSW